MSATISVSQFHDTQEINFTLFPVTIIGIKEAKYLLGIKGVNRFRHCLTPSQFENPYDGQIEEAYRLLEAEDVAGLATHMRKCQPQM